MWGKKRLGFGGEAGVAIKARRRRMGARNQRMAGAWHEDGRRWWRRAARRDSCSAHRSRVKPEVPVLGTCQAKNQKLRFLKPAVPVSAGLCHGMRATSEMEEGTDGKVKGDVLMLTPCSGRAEKGRRMELDA